MDGNDLCKCICGCEVKLKLWTRLNADIIHAEEYSYYKGRRLNRGAIDLYACPSCGTVKYVSRHKKEEDDF